jgi:hypothetical protein
VINSAAAIKIIGNQPTFAVRNMALALSLMPSLNTPEDWLRLKAAVVWLRSKHQRVPRRATQILKEYAA